MTPQAWHLQKGVEILMNGLFDIFDSNYNGIYYGEYVYKVLVPSNNF